MAAVAGVNPDSLVREIVTMGNIQAQSTDVVIGVQVIAALAGLFQAPQLIRSTIVIPGDQGVVEPPEPLTSR